MKKALRRTVELCVLSFVAGATGQALGENSTTIDLSTQPHLKSWSNVIPNAQKRFVVLADFANAAVLDRETGLVWERSPDSSRWDWQGARYNCINLVRVGGRMGWRLPSVAELASLLDPNVAPPGPTLPPGHPFLNVQPAGYWTSSLYAGIPTAAWYVEFENAQVSTETVPTGPTGSRPGPAWCVRGGMNTDTY